MRSFFILFIKELRSFFLSPLAYVVMALFIFLNGWVFDYVVNVMKSQPSANSLIYNWFSWIFFWMGFLIFFPLITMRVFAEERKLGTVEGLFTAPVRTSEVVLAKYAATVVSYVVMLAPVFGFLLLFKGITGTEAAFHSGAFWGAALALLLVGMFYIAMGIFASSLTSNQLIAAMITYVGVVLHFLLGILHLMIEVPWSQWGKTLTYFSTHEHVQLFGQGVIDSRPIVYYLSFSAVFLFLTHHVLEFRKWRA